MTISSSRTLEQQTRMYWQVSRCWFGHPINGRPITVQEALKRTSTVLASTPSKQLVSQKTLALQQAIIYRLDPQPPTPQDQDSAIRKA